MTSYWHARTHARVARFFLVQYSKAGKIYQINLCYTKWPQNRPNDCKIDQMAIKYADIFHLKTLQKFTQIGSFGLKINHLATLGVPMPTYLRWCKSFKHRNPKSYAKRHMFERRDTFFQLISTLFCEVILKTPEILFLLSKLPCLPRVEIIQFYARCSTSFPEKVFPGPMPT
jgi:hypothetical protein